MGAVLMRVRHATSAHDALTQELVTRAAASCSPLPPSSALTTFHTAPRSSLLPSFPLALDACVLLTRGCGVQVEVECAE
eukprot:2827992-Rhodomonas_salina.1